MRPLPDFALGFGADKFAITFGIVSHTNASGSGYLTTIQRVNLVSNADGQEVGDMATAKAWGCGNTGKTAGYFCAGLDASVQYTEIDRYNFASLTDSVVVADGTIDSETCGGSDSHSHGYHHGGFAGTYINVIEKFQFAPNADATDVGDLTVSRNRLAGATALDYGYGYGVGGYTGTYSDVIDKYSYSSDGNAADVGDLSDGRYYIGGHSSNENGYCSGGFDATAPTGPDTNIDKFPFSSDTNASQTADLVTAVIAHGTGSSREYGFTYGGQDSVPAYNDSIQKFPFASDDDATDIANLVLAVIAVATECPNGQ